MTPVSRELRSLPHPSRAQWLTRSRFFFFSHSSRFLASYFPVQHLLYDPQPLATAAAAAAANRTQVILEQLVSAAGTMPCIGLGGRRRGPAGLGGAFPSGATEGRDGSRPTEEPTDAVLALAEKRLAGVLEQSRVSVDKLNGEIQVGPAGAPYSFES